MGRYLHAPGGRRVIIPPHVTVNVNMVPGEQPRSSRGEDTHPGMGAEVDGRRPRRFRVFTGAGQTLVCDSWVLWRVIASFGANGYAPSAETKPRAEAFADRLNEVNERRLAAC